jgi:hypothetical protein
MISISRLINFFGNQRTAVHKNSAFYDLEGFKKGANVLAPMSFSRIVEKSIDISNNAIKLAREINDGLKF